MSLASLVLAAAPLFEIELRRVEQTVVASGTSGSLSTVQARITPLGPLLRVQAGALAEWSWEAQAEQLLTLQAGPRERGARLTQTLPGVRWQLGATLQPQGRDRIRVQLRWQQPAEGGAQAWQSTLTLRPGHWTVLAREQPGRPPAPGTLSTQPLAQIQELQLRVSPVSAPGD
jgi:hypothetical protein